MEAKRIFDEEISLSSQSYDWTNQFIEALQDGFWTDRLFNFQSDIQDFKVNLPQEQRDMIVRCLSLIGQTECSVKVFWAKIGENLPHPSIYDLGYTMANSEVIHGKAYTRLLKVLGIKDSFEEILKLPIISGRTSYLKKHLHKFHSDNKKQFIYSLILFTLIVENVSLFTQFYTISWFGRFKNTLKDTNKQVEYTSREENLHAMIGVKLINVIREEYPDLFDKELEEKVLKEASKAIEYECEIVDWILGGFEDENLNPFILKEFVKSRMNDSLVQIGYQKVCDVDNDILNKVSWFDEQLLGNNHSDFFVSRPTEYSKNSQSFDENELF